MPHSATTRRLAEAIPRKKARAYVHVALRQTIVDMGLTHAEFARRCGVAESTLTRWLSEKRPVLLEAVLCSRRVARHFLVCLLAEFRGAKGRA